MKAYYESNGITIFHGDCREILPTLTKVDLVLTDPPYGIGENANRIKSRTKLAKTTDYGSFDWDKEPASLEEITLTLSAGDGAIVWGGNYFHVPPSRGWLVWDKQNSGNFADCELAWTNLQMSVRMFRFMWNGMIRAGEARGIPRVHPTQKPLELMTWCITKADDHFDRPTKTILDPFMGSGTTLRAAKDLGRQAIGIELEEKYCEIAARRLQQEVFAL
jgi:site-specific DNA-methyltransferase (adenine-specific)